MTNTNASKKYIISTLVIMAIIFIHSSLPAEVSADESSIFVEFFSSFFGFAPDEGFHYVIRKIAHMIEYFTLGVSMTLLTLSGVEKIELKPCLISWIICTVYGLTDELHQYLVPGRSCELLDVLIDSIGALLGVAIVFLIKRKRSSG